MKKQLRQIALAAALGTPGFCEAQLGPSFLSAPDGSPIDALIVNNEGRIGIGTTAPQTTVHVTTGGVHAGGGVGWQNEGSQFVGNPNNGERWVWHARNGAARLWSNDDKLTVTPNGRVGIGTDLPQARLDVNGNANIASDFVVHGRTTLHNTVEMVSDRLDVRLFGRDACGIQFFNENTGNFWLMTRRVDEGQPDDFRLFRYRNGVYQGSSLFARMDNGYVGIGTINPQRQLHIHGTEIHSSGPFAGFSFNDRASDESFVDSPVNGSRWEWYSLNGWARLWSGNDKLSVDPSGNMTVIGRVSCQILELTSDRHQKAGFAPLNSSVVLDKVLGLPITSWHYTNSPDVAHVGPMAQDFKAIFNLGADDKHIGAGDGIGVALAAIQGLNARLEQTLTAKDSEIAALRREVVLLKQELASERSTMADRLAVLEKAVSKVAVQQASLRLDAGH